MKEILTIFSFLILFVFSCATKENHVMQQNADMKISPQKSDTSDLYYKDIKLWNTWLKLSDIQKNSSDLEFRLWLYPELSVKKQMILIHKSAGSWKGVLYSFDIRNAKLESSKDLIPKSNWENIENTFLNLKVGQLPNDSNVPADLLYDDGITFILEIADTKSYRFSKFSNPQQIRKLNKEASRWDALLSFISKEFDIPH